MLPVGEFSHMSEASQQPNGDIVVYRYFTEQFGLLALQQQKWKIGRLLELNDPFDCQPVFWQKQGKKTVHSSGNGHPYFQGLYDSIGVICYSLSINDPVVWSHYADGHRGIALGFKYGPGDGLFQMRYPGDDSRANLDFEVVRKFKRGSQEALDIISHSFTQKAKSWAYEREYRHFIFLHGCEMIGSHYFRGMPLQNLRHVVLGVKSHVTESDVRRIIDAWKISSDVTITKARISLKSYKIIVS
jgi:hypothetical protein